MIHLMTLAHRLRKLWWRIARPRTFGVKVIATDSAGQVLLVKPVYASTWQLPGGGVHRFEHPAEAAARELHEETGIEVTAESLQLREVLMSTHEGKSDTVIVYGAVMESVEPVPDGREIAAAAWFSTDQLPDDIAGSVRRRLFEAGEHRIW